MVNIEAIGMNSTILNDLVRLAKNNPDQISMAETFVAQSKVSPYLLHMTKYPTKLQKILADIGIYNIVLLEMAPGVFTVTARLSNNQLVSKDIPKDTVKNTADALKTAILSFIAP